MASLHLPLSPSDSVRLDDKLLSFLDLVYLRRDGSLVFDETLARRYAAAWTQERFQPLLAPVIAELAADMIEYRARAECRAAGLELPSSSLFAHHPAKLDFAWADLSFFVKALKRVNTLYEKDEALQRRFRGTRAAAFPAQVPAQLPSRRVAGSLRRGTRHPARTPPRHFPRGAGNRPGPRSLEGRPLNAFSQAFLNLLRIGVTLNGIVHGQLEAARPQLAPYFQTLVMFVVKYFERDPWQGFWTLDETLAAHAVPLLEALASADDFAQDHRSSVA